MRGTRRCSPTLMPGEDGKVIYSAMLIVIQVRQVTALQHQVALAYAIQGNASAQAATGKLIYLPQQDITLLVVEGLPQLQGTHVYQGWLIHGKQPKSIGLFSVQNGIASLTFPGNIAGYELAAVSMEPGPAASKGVPAGPVMAAGELTHPILPE
jgi:anti-sigma-K factor RskA